MSGRTVALEVTDVTAADIVEALRGRPPANDAEERRRQALADLLAKSLFSVLTRKDDS